MKIITLASLKGGVGKTTTAALTAAALASSRPGRVLLVDLDANNNLTDLAARGVPEEELEARNVLHVIAGTRPAGEAIFPSDLVEGLSILPAVPALARVGIEHAADPGVLLRFPAALRRLPFDFILIDSPPALTLEFRAALYSADVVLVPVGLSRWSVQAFSLVSAEVAAVKESIGKGPEALAVPAMVSDGEAVKLRALLEGIPFTSSSIPRNAAIKNAASAAALPKPGSVGAEAFAALAEEVAAWA